MALLYPDARRVFLLDGDALVLANDKLLPILEMLQHFFPRLTRIASYANGYNLVSRTQAQLQQLFDHKLRLIYIGLESGSQDILNLCHKKATAIEMISAVEQAKQVGIKSSVIVLLGLGGREHSSQHKAQTIEALNKMQPHYLSFLSLMVIPGTPLHDEVRSGQFTELGSKELLEDAYEILKGLTLSRTLFRMNHASNYLPLEGTLPHDKEKLLALLAQGISGNISLRPELLRGL